MSFNPSTNKSRSPKAASDFAFTPFDAFTFLAD